MPSHDDQLIAILRSRRITVGRRRLHRWRLEHVFPSNQPGRPRRDSPGPEESAVELAAFLAEHLRPGLGIEIVSLYAFGLRLPLPEKGARRALAWCAQSMHESVGGDEEPDARWDAIEAAGREMTRMRNPLASEIRGRLRRHLRTTASTEGIDSVLWSTYTTLLLAMSGMEVSSEGMAELFTAMGYSESIERLDLAEDERVKVHADFQRDMSGINLAALDEALERSSWDEVLAARERVVRWLEEVEAVVPAIEVEVPGAFGLPFFLDPAQRPIVIATQTLLSLAGVIHTEGAV